MSEQQLNKGHWVTLREFTPDDYIKWFLEETKAGRMTEERLNEANWGVSAQFLLNASFDSEAAEQAKWMKPLLFLTGVGVGMLGASVMTLVG